ncbi:hypothetical protein [Streptomyces sp. NPDC057428]|uniref:hypothetical protein n=1 Tax=Streptomyces sp. NPDC057428 TaxID=3346129 RepID=UPI003682B838
MARAPSPTAASRGLGLSEVRPHDPRGTGTVRSVAARMDEVITQGLRTRPAAVRPGDTPQGTAESRRQHRADLVISDPGDLLITGLD